MTKWRNKINVKEYFTDDVSDESILKVTEKLLPQLRFVYKSEIRIRETEIKHGRNPQLTEYFLDDFKEIIENFELIKDAITNNEDADEYSWDSWVEAFNSYLRDLYDIGDVAVDETKSFFEREKFMWVG